MTSKNAGSALDGLKGTSSRAFLASSISALFSSSKEKPLRDCVHVFAEIGIVWIMDSVRRSTRTGRRRASKYNRQRTERRALPGSRWPVICHDEVPGACWQASNRPSPPSRTLQAEIHAVAIAQVPERLKPSIKARAAVGQAVFHGVRLVSRGVPSNRPPPAPGRSPRNSALQPPSERQRATPSWLT